MYSNVLKNTRIQNNKNTPTLEYFYLLLYLFSCPCSIIPIALFTSDMVCAAIG